MGLPRGRYKQACTANKNLLDHLVSCRHVFKVTSQITQFNFVHDCTLKYITLNKTHPLFDGLLHDIADTVEATYFVQPSAGFCGLFQVKTTRGCHLAQKIFIVKYRFKVSVQNIEIHRCKLTKTSYSGISFQWECLIQPTHLLVVPVHDLVVSETVQPIRSPQFLCTSILLCAAAALCTSLK